MDNLKDSYELSYMVVSDSKYLGMVDVPKITDARQVAEFGGFFKLVPTAIKVNDTEYAIDYNVNSICYKDGHADKDMRWNFVNESTTIIVNMMQKLREFWLYYLMTKVSIHQLTTYQIQSMLRLEIRCPIYLRLVSLRIK